MPGLSVAIVAAGDPLSSDTWSGFTCGLAGGFEELGVEVVPVDSRPPRPVLDLARAALAPRFALAALPAAGRALLLAEMSSRMGAVFGATAERRLRGHEVDAVVQIGASHRPPGTAPATTLEDMTVSQAVAAGYPLWSAMPRRAVEARRRIQAAVYRHVRACCFLTSWAAESARRDYGVADERISVVGVGRNHQPQPPPQRDWSQPRFLFVGRQWERKRGDAVVRAFARLRERIPAATLDVVGGHPPLAAPGVTGHGELDAEVAALFSRATCCVVPSKVEPAGIVYAEAAAAGIPSIGTTAGGAPDIIGEAGRVVPPGDDEALLAAMLDLSDPETARRLGRLALERADRFTWRATAERTLRALALGLV
jgi:glycosyltransferase involved in cell wall biosynthesis